MFNCDAANTSFCSRLVAIAITAVSTLGCQPSMSFYLKDHGSLYTQPQVETVTLVRGQRVKAFSRNHGTHVFALSGTVCFETANVARAVRQHEGVWLTGVNDGQTIGHYCDAPRHCIDAHVEVTELRAKLAEKKAYMLKNKASMNRKGATRYTRQMNEWGLRLIDTDIDSLDRPQLVHWLLTINCIARFEIRVGSGGG